MKILHTADWHLGRRLYGRNRHHEYSAFLNWLLATIENRHIDALIIAGDIFDNTTPNIQTQTLYYHFLHRLATSHCRHTVITAGNHDSPAFLDAPRELLHTFNIHIIGAARAPEDEVLLLHTPDGQPELIICAIPYLRESDLRHSERGESAAEKSAKTLNGIREHYRAAVAYAETLRTGHPEVPLIATGHLYTAGGKTGETNDHQIGTLVHVPADTFPENIDYLALGHIHLAQCIGGSDTHRYSGSPLAHTFNEARQQKSLCLLETDGRSIHVEKLAVPEYQRRETVCGDLTRIEERLNQLRAENGNIWLEIHYQGDTVAGNLNEHLHALTTNSLLEILRIKNERIREQLLTAQQNDETLHDLNPTDIFERCLDAHQVPAEERQALRENYRETLNSLDEEPPSPAS